MELVIDPYSTQGSLKQKIKRGYHIEPWKRKRHTIGGDVRSENKPAPCLAHHPTCQQMVGEVAGCSRSKWWPPVGEAALGRDRRQQFVDVVAGSSTPGMRPTSHIRPTIIPAPRLPFSSRVTSAGRDRRRAPSSAIRATPIPGLVIP